MVNRVQYFLDTMTAWEIYELDDELCIYMENSTHDVTVNYNKTFNKIENYEAYNSLGDNSVLWDSEELILIEEWIKNKYTNGIQSTSESR